MSELLGCFYLPSSRRFQPDRRPRPEALIGGASDDSRRIHLKQTSIVEALPVLLDAIGRRQSMIWGAFDSPVIVHPTRRELGVRYQINAGSWYSICGESLDYQPRVLILTLDEDGIITGTRTVDAAEATAGGFRAFDNVDVQRLFGARGDQLFATTRPTTEPNR